MQLILILIALILSGLFSGSETALISASRLRLQSLIKEKVTAAKLAYNFIRDPEKFIITTLVGNNIMLVLYSSLFAIYLEKFFVEHVVVIISSTVLLILGEIIPKSIFRERANRWVIPLSYLMRMFYYVFMPINKIFQLASRLLTRIFKADQTEEQVIISRRSMARIIKEGFEVGAIEEEKGEMLFKSILVGRQQIKQVMQPRTEIVAIEKSASIDEAIKLFKTSGLSQLAVYEKDIDNIIGKIHIKDLFNFPTSVDHIIREVIIVPESKPTIKLFQDFRQSKQNLAIAIDEYGSTSGIVTLEDIIEELFGEIDDEHDPERPLYKKLDRKTYLVNGRLEIDFANKELNFGLPKGDYETIAGMIITELGHIPQEGEKIDVGRWRFIIKTAGKRRIRWIKMVQIPKS